MADQVLQADLVLEGGGVKGIALVGAVSVLQEAGYSFPRVAGTSAGSIVGALVASGMPAEQMLEVMRTTDYSKFQDGTILDRLGPLGQGLSVLFQSGIYEGEYLKDYLRRLLPDDMETFAGLRLPEDPNSDLPEERRYKLVVMASDVSRHLLVRFPWDYRDYGLVPDEQSVVDAVRASMSIPFFFEPTHLDAIVPGEDGKTRRERCTLVDGGMLSNFPVGVFDRTDGRTPRWPTFGIKLSGKPGAPRPPRLVHGPLSLTFGMLATLIGWSDRGHIQDPLICKRTIFVETFGISAVSFDLGQADQQRLYDSGRRAATEFLETWDFGEYKEVRARELAARADAAQADQANTGPTAG
jgi:NTE family protein